MYATISFSSNTAKFLTGMYIGENKNKVQGLRDRIQEEAQRIGSLCYHPLLPPPLFSY